MTCFSVTRTSSVVSASTTSPSSSSTAGTVLGGGGGYLVDTIQKARGKGSIFQNIDEFEPKVFDDTKVSAKDLDAPLKVGTTVKAPDRQNVGTVIGLDDKTGVATVRFTIRS